jgi:hypothetical protein
MKWTPTLGYYGIKKGNTAYNAFLKACDDIHPKPWKPIRRKSLN